MKLSIIIVNYNVRYFLEQCLLSVRRAVEGIDAEVFVVDNDSKDDSVEMVREKFPEVKLIANQDNPGFSKANNQAIRQSKGEFVLLLNPDTVVEEDTFSQCIQFMEGHPDAGALGVKMIDGSGTFLPESKRGFPSPWVAFCKTFGLSTFFPKSELFNSYHLGFLDENENHQVDVLAGAFMFMRKSVLDKIGLLDETFFMYGEDIDLSYRVQLGGFKNYYVADTTIIHYKGESTRKGSLNYVKVFYNAMIIFAKKHFTGRKAWLFVLMLQAAIWVRAGMTLFGNFFKNAWLPIVDALIMVTGIWALQGFWANYHFGRPEYFDSPKFYFFNIPFYLIFWLSSIYLSGGYDRPLKVKNLIRGLLFGTLFMTATYGLIPNDYRFSRALIVLTTVWTLFLTIGFRLFLHFWKNKNFDIGSTPDKNMVIVGSQQEGEKVMKLLQQAGVQKKLIGLISPNEKTDNDFLGSLKALDDLVHIYRIDEIIFCSSNVSGQQIMHWMTKLGPEVAYKILPQESYSIIGSHSKNAPGELYTVDIQYNIASPMNRRNKRVFDLGMALLMLPLLPIVFLIINARFTFLKNWFQTLVGQKTWVGYSTNSKAESLPKLKPSVLSPVDGLKIQLSDEATIQRLNFLYARDFEIDRDIEILRKGWRKLGS